MGKHVQRPRFRRVKLVILVCLGVGAVDVAYLWAIWPDWQTLRVKVTKSAFIERYEDRREHQKLPRLRWRPVPDAKISSTVKRAVVLAEDSRFFTHGGVDWTAIGRAAAENVDDLDVSFGGSSITQQLAKNLFLSNARTPWRKWHELWLTWGLERNLSKSRILTLYLNVAEFGVGVYGVEAAGQHYFGASAGALSVDQAAGIAACLPSPKRHNPATATQRFGRRKDKILGHIERFGL